MRWELVFLNVSNVRLPDGLTKMLVRIAWVMLHEFEKEVWFDWEDWQCEGVLRTKFERFVFFHFSGVVFEAEMETNRGNAFVRFLVNDRDTDFFSSLPDEALTYWGPADFSPSHDAYKYN